MLDVVPIAGIATVERKGEAHSNSASKSGTKKGTKKALRKEPFSNRDCASAENSLEQEEK